MKAALATPERLVAPRERAAARVTLFAAALGFLWFVLCRALSGEWSLNEQYSYGWFVPLFCAYLFWLRWEDRPAGEFQIASFQSQVAAAAAIAALLVLLPLRVFEIGNPDWRPLGWLHALIVIALTLIGLGSIGGARWARHFAFPVAFILVAVPWVSPVEQPLVQGLMRVIAASATEALTLCGVPAEVEGSLIRISSGVVGVNEACSGVRALQSAVMIGLLFGELKRFSVGRRLALVAVAIGLSIFANFVRTFVLVLVAAKQGIGAVDRWHDVAGYSIVALVFLGTLATTAVLGGKSQRGHRPEIGGQRSAISSFILHPSRYVFVLCWLAFVEIASAGWYRIHERNLVARTRWNVQWPRSEQSFRELKIDEPVRGTLRFDQGHAARWEIESPMGATAAEPRLHCTVFFFRWNAGGGTLLRARAHRPEICLPSAGWEQTADDGARFYSVGAGVMLQFRHLEFARAARSRFDPNQFAHTFFCLHQDWMEPKNSTGARTALVTSQSRDWGVRARARAVQEGVRDLGQQTMELVFTSSHPVSGAAAEAKFVQLIPRLIKVEPAKTGE